jgi:hypothetical protein
VQFDALANVGWLDDAGVVDGFELEAEDVEVLTCVVLVLCELCFVVVVVGVLDPPQAATSTAVTAPTDSSRNRIYQSPW